MREKKSRNKIVGIAMICLVVGMLGASGAMIYLYHNDEGIKLPTMKDVNKNSLAVDSDSDDGTWHEVARISSKDIMLGALGEYAPGDGSSHWCSTFVLDYGQDPDTVLADNETDWSAAATARGYVDSDAQTIDLAAEDPGYFVVRAGFNADAQEDGSWNYSRFRANLTITGDEVDGNTISDVGEFDNSSTAGGGDAVISGDTADWLYINFYWDDQGDEGDGFALAKDGSIDWEVTIYAKY